MGSLLIQGLAAVGSAAMMTLIFGALIYKISGRNNSNKFLKQMGSELDHHDDYRSGELIGAGRRPVG